MEAGARPSSSQRSGHSGMSGRVSGRAKVGADVTSAPSHSLPLSLPSQKAGSTRPAQPLTYRSTYMG